MAALAPAVLWSSGCAADLVAPSDTAPVGAVDAAQPPAAAAKPDVAGALAVLATLPVKGRAPRTGYERARFGEAWTDDVDVEGGHNGCDTRNDILKRDLSAPITKDGTAGCKVLSGTHFDEYTGETGSFTSGPDTSPLVQIDHLVPLSNAWQTGAQQLDESARTALANDPLNLQAVAGAVNQEKGDGDAATWLPPRKAYRCTYIGRQIEVKARYGLWVTQAEHDAMTRVLSDCDTSDSPAAPRSETAPTDHADTYFAHCADARAAGAAPLYAGRPGYRPEMDGDGDGVACESA
ncbi:GmrSD restriction endonuclease domain-containing protein [Rhodococcus triatomae]